MKKIILICLCVGISTILTAQIEWKKEIPSIGLFFVSGAANGTAELVKWHPSAFQNVFPNANPNWFDPHISWRNKYRNGDPSQGPAYFGSTTFLVGTTDLYHGARTVSNTTMILAAVFSPRDCLKLKTILIKFLVYSAAYHAGFWLTYELPLNIQKRK